MTNLGDKTRELCFVISKEILNNRCNKIQRIKDIEKHLEKINSVRQENKYRHIPGFHVINQYQSNLESILDGLKRMEALKNQK